LKPTEANSLELVRLCCRSLDDKKGGDISILDVRGVSSITDYLVIVTATSEPHVRALRVELEKAVDSAKSHVVRFETAHESGWAVMDAFNVMVHIFTPERRRQYGLEKLWRDGNEVPLKRILAEPKAPAKKAAKAPKKKPAVKKKSRK
jgi:ribosome-associated protein